MPGIDELPRPAQAELRAKLGEGELDHPEKRKVSLLRRLAAVGLGRRDEQEEAQKMPAPVRPARPAVPRPLDRPLDRPMDRAPPAPRPAMPAPPMPRAPEPPVSEYAKRPPPPGPDPLLRQAPMPPMPKAVEEDQLDIPAFLRRQAN
jgi:cell division protein FtsZ